MIGIYDYTVILTYLSLVSGLLGMKFACEGKLSAAICCLLISGVCDMFDGVVARSKKNRTDDERNFGIQIDSLCDAICFGVFPAVLLYFCGVDSAAGTAVLVLYVLCAVIRLAFFNVLETKRQMREGGSAKEYRGLPVTSIAIILPFFYFIRPLLPHSVLQVIYHVIPVLVAALFIVNVRVPKLDVTKVLRKRAVK